MAPACSCSAQKCMKPGRITRNGYLNFLREFRKSNCGLSAVETVRKGAQKWRSMSPKDKSKYNEMAKNAPMIARRSRIRAGAGRSRRGSRMRGGRNRGSRGRGSRTRRQRMK